MRLQYIFTYIGYIQEDSSLNKPIYGIHNYLKTHVRMTNRKIDNSFIRNLEIPKGFHLVTWDLKEEFSIWNKEEEQGCITINVILDKYNQFINSKLTEIIKEEKQLSKNYGEFRDNCYTIHYNKNQEEANRCYRTHNFSKKTAIEITKRIVEKFITFLDKENLKDIYYFNDLKEYSVKTFEGKIKDFSKLKYNNIFWSKKRAIKQLQDIQRFESIDFIEYKGKIYPVHTHPALEIERDNIK